jgi:DNA-binding transcriptional regulator YiaG
MPWKEISVEQLAKSLNVDINEIREKRKLTQLIVKIRQKKKMSQAELAKKMEVSQGRIAQIESGYGPSKVSFDVLLNILTTLGYRFHIVTKKAA